MKTKQQEQRPPPVFLVLISAVLIPLLISHRHSPSAPGQLTMSWCLTLSLTWSPAYKDIWCAWTLKFEVSTVEPTYPTTSLFLLCPGTRGINTDTFILCVPLSLNKLSIQKYLLTHIKSFRHCRVHANLPLWGSILHYTRFPWQTELTLPRMSTKPKFFHYHHCYCCSRIQVQKALYILILSLSQVCFFLLNWTTQAEFLMSFSPLS